MAPAHPNSPPRRRWRLGRVAVAFGLVMAVSACSREPGRSTTVFCDRLRTEAPGLEGPLATPDDVSALVERYRSLAALAPLSIQQEWDAVTALVQAAAEVDLADPVAVRALNEQAYATEQAARDVSDWARTRCELDLPVGGLAPRPIPEPAETTPDGEPAEPSEPDDAG